MRPLLLCIIVSGWLVGYGCGETWIEGSPDTTVDPYVDTAADLTIDLAPETDSPEDSTEEEPPVAGECGNGIVEAGEECDDGDTDDCNGCSNACTWERALQNDGFWHIGAIVEEAIPCLPTFFTVEAWFRIGDGGGFRYLIMEDDSFYISIRQYDSTYESHFLISSEIPTGAIVSGAELSDGVVGEWHHVVATGLPAGPDEDPGVMWEFGFFFDGVWVDTSADWDWLPGLPCRVPLEILDGGAGGTIDELRISSGVLYTSDFIPSRYLSVESNTIALWRFDEEVGGVIPDVSGNGHDAVLVDGTLVPDDCHTP